MDYPAATLATYRPHATNAASAARGSALIRYTVCLVRLSARAMPERLGALALDKAERTRSSVARS
jgi:hypothetical protein